MEVVSTGRERAEKRRSPIGMMRAGHCPRCGEKGAHFVPPSFGDPGFYICEAKEASDGT